MAALTMDRYGRIWPNVPAGLLCPECGQPAPDATSCDHQDAGQDGLAVTRGGLSLLGLRVSVRTGDMVTFGMLKELTEDTVVVEAKHRTIYRMHRRLVDRVMGPLFEEVR